MIPEDNNNKSVAHKSKKMYLLSHKWGCDHDVRQGFLIGKSSPLPLAGRQGRVGEVAQGRGGHSRGGGGGRDKEDPLLTFASNMIDFILLKTQIKS